MPLHQSAPWVDSVKHASLPVVVHSALFSLPVQDGDGKLAWSARALLCAPFRLCLTCSKLCGTFPCGKPVSAPCFGEAEPRSYEIWPSNCRGTTPSPELWIMTCIAVEWPVSPIAFFHCPVWGPFLPSHPFLFLVCRRVSQSRFSSASPVVHPPLPLPSTS